MPPFALVPAAYVVLLRPRRPGGDEVLLHLRRDTGYYDEHWALVAGHVDPDESVLAAAVREAREEVGVAIEPADLEPLATLHRTLRGGGPVEQRVDFFFVTRRWDGEPAVREPAKNGGLRWARLDALPDPLAPHEADVLARLHRGDLPAVLLSGWD